MQTILLIGHGSRNPNGNQQIAEWSAKYQKLHPNWRIEVCYIEFAEVLLAEGLDKAAIDADTVLVLPLILNAAGHIKSEIPQFIDEARSRHPQTTFIYGSHFGVCQPMLAIVVRRLAQVMQRMHWPCPKTTGVVLLGRGSSDLCANADMAKLARWLFESCDHELVDLAFTGITYPRLEQIVQRQVLLGMTQVVILPYYLFDGTLLSRIGEQHQHLQRQYPHIRFGISDCLGFEPEITTLLDENIAKLQSQTQTPQC